MSQWIGYGCEKIMDNANVLCWVSERERMLLTELRKTDKGVSLEGREIVPSQTCKFKRPIRLLSGDVE